MNGCDTIISAGDCARPLIEQNYPDLQGMIAAVLTITLFVWAAAKTVRFLGWVVTGR